MKYKAAEIEFMNSEHRANGPADDLVGAAIDSLFGSAGHMEKADQTNPTPMTPTPELEAKIKDFASRWKAIEKKSAADPKLAKTVKPFHDHWLQFYGNWQAGSKDVTDVNAVAADLRAAQDYAGIAKYTDYTHVRGIDTSDELGKEVIDYTKYPWCQPCKDVLPDFVCKTVDYCPGGVRVSDIPWWVWAVGASGVAGLAVMIYGSFKAAPYVAQAAPYVLSVIPETAPLGVAWAQARAAEQQAQSMRR
jgi:hypothetical protein